MTSCNPAGIVARGGHTLLACKTLLGLALPGAFTLLPTAKVLSRVTVVLGSMAALAAVLGLTKPEQQLRKQQRQHAACTHRPWLTPLQLGMTAASMAVVMLSDKSAPYLKLQQLMAWAIYVTSPLLPLLAPLQWRQRWVLAGHEHLKD